MCLLFEGSARRYARGCVHDMAYGEALSRLDRGEPWADSVSYSHTLNHISVLGSAYCSSSGPNWIQSHSSVLLCYSHSDEFWLLSCPNVAQSGLET